jgi:hypothetical protein
MIEKIIELAIAAMLSAAIVVSIIFLYELWIKGFLLLFGVFRANC